MSDHELRSADHLEPEILYRAFVEAFSDYLIGPPNLALAEWPQFLARQAIDLRQSRVAVSRGEVLAFSFVAPRPSLGAWRLASMGAVPRGRGSGAAPSLLDDFLARAAAAGLAHGELECFAENERARRLYASRGFEVISALCGYERSGGTAELFLGDHPEPETIDAEEAFALLDVITLQRRDLPLQVTPACLRAASGRSRAMRSGRAVVVYGETAADQLTLHSLVDTDPGQDGARALVATLMRNHPKHRIIVPRLQRPDVGGRALEELGFARQALHQLLMRKRL